MNIQLKFAIGSIPLNKMVTLTNYKKTHSTMQRMQLFSSNLQKDSFMTNKAILNVKKPDPKYLPF